MTDDGLFRKRSHHSDKQGRGLRLLSIQRLVNRSNSLSRDGDPKHLLDIANDLETRNLQAHHESKHLVTIITMPAVSKMKRDPPFRLKLKKTHPYILAVSYPLQTVGYGTRFPRNDASDAKGSIAFGPNTGTLPGSDGSAATVHARGDSRIIRLEVEVPVTQSEVEVTT